MHPLEQFVNEIHQQHPVGDHLKIAFSAAYQALATATWREAHPSPIPEQIYLELPKLTFPYLAPPYMRSVRLRDVRPLIEQAEVRDEARIAMHDDLPIVFAARLMRRQEASIAWVAAENGAFYVRYEDVDELDRLIENTFEQGAEEALREVLQAHLPAIRLKSIQEHFVRHHFTPASHLVYQAVVQVQCALQVWYQCVVDQTCIMNRSDCPRDRSHTTQRLSAPHTCCP